MSGRRKGRRTGRGKVFPVRAPPLRPALSQGVDDRLAACRQRRPACRGTVQPSVKRPWVRASGDLPSRLSAILRFACEAPGEVLAAHSAAGCEIPDKFVDHYLVRAAYAGGVGRLPEGVPVAGPRQHPEHRGLPPGGPLRETREPGREAAAEHRQGLVQRRNRPLVRRPGGGSERVVLWSVPAR